MVRTKNYRDVELSSVGKVRIYAPPTQQISVLLRRKYPYPPKPESKTKTATGETIVMIVDDDPDWIAECERLDEKRAQEAEELYALAEFQDMEVPDDFDPENDLMWVSYGDPDWKPRQGPNGRKLDYIEWFVCGMTMDMSKVQDAVYDMLGIDIGVTETVEETFRDQVEAQAT